MVAVRAVASKCRRIHRAEIRRAVHGVKKSYVRGVEEVESLRDHFKASLFAEWDRTPDAEIHGTEVVANKGVARLDADPIVVAENISIGVEARELGKTHGRLHRGDQAKEEVARKGIPRLRSCNRSVHHDAVPHIVG